MKVWVKNRSEFLIPDHMTGWASENGFIYARKATKIERLYSTNQIETIPDIRARHYQDRKSRQIAKASKVFSENP